MRWRGHMWRGTSAALLASCTLVGACSSAEADGHGAAIGQEQNAGVPACRAEPAEEIIAATNAYGRLEGTLALPAGCGPFPTVLIVAGSGPTDRDGNSVLGVRAQPYRLLADRLRDRGIASIRYDKGAIGASAAAAPPTPELTIEQGSADAALFVALARADRRISRLTLVGHSEGALVGALAAQMAPVDGYMSLAGLGRPTATVLREQLARGLAAQPELLEAANHMIDALERGEPVGELPPALANMFPSSIHGFLHSLMRHDPAAQLGRLGAAVDIVVAQGTTDVQISVADAERLAEARPDARLVLVDGMNHVLKAADLSPASQQLAYTSPDLPLVPELVDAVAALALR